MPSGHVRVLVPADPSDGTPGSWVNRMERRPSEAPGLGTAQATIARTTHDDVCSRDRCRRESRTRSPGEAPHADVAGVRVDFRVQPGHPARDRRPEVEDVPETETPKGERPCR